MGEMQFTHFGVSGPLGAVRFAHMRISNNPKEKYRIEIDLKPH
jgi:predicted flavoprotein YhiN